MKITKRTNTATIVLDFQDLQSCLEAMHFIKDNCELIIEDKTYIYPHFSGVAMPDNEVQTSKIKIIKLLRSYGQFVMETKNTGLKTAKEWVERHEREWDKRPIK